MAAVIPITPWSTAVQGFARTSNRELLFALGGTEPGPRAKGLLGGGICE